MNESIQWFPASNRPDADMIVLVHCPGQTEPIWLGYWDDNDATWRTCDGMWLDVSHWAELPSGPTV